jgi:hypothetical protein
MKLKFVRFLANWSAIYETYNELEKNNRTEFAENTHQTNHVRTNCTVTYVRHLKIKLTSTVSAVKEIIGE